MLPNASKNLSISWDNYNTTLAVLALLQTQVHIAIQQYFRSTACEEYDFINVTSLADTPKVNVCELAVFLTSGGSKYVRMKYRKRGHFISLIIKSQDFENCT